MCKTNNFIIFFSLLHSACMSPTTQFKKKLHWLWWMQQLEGCSKGKKLNYYQHFLLNNTNIKKKWARGGGTGGKKKMLKPLHSCRILKNIYSEIITFLYSTFCMCGDAVSCTPRDAMVTLLMKKTSRNFRTLCSGQCVYSFSFKKIYF